ncbi:hypothetical protein LF1_14540 [Rubripirellula obstinata]|uniref:Uncharacterized protein n=1 Tax=Rubripirellula obstinata TaxID=406547 RepID=A0A5B1CH81_9BACT|nr:hypothetical protein [Rubripirellula obstinata]KAA1258930.1 hypothetical protein LF1_14540 [Rubripirellula obstinata]
MDELQTRLPTLPTTVEDFFSLLFEHAPEIAKHYALFKQARDLKRLETLFQYLRGHTDKFVGDFAKSEAGFHLLEEVVDRVSREHTEQKRQHFANLIVSSWLDNRPVQLIFDEASLFARAIDRFTNSHIAIIQHLYDAEEKTSVKYDELGKVAGDRDCHILLHDICGEFGLANRSWGLHQTTSPALMVSTNLSPEGIARNCLHAITPRGRRFVSKVLSG